MQTFPAIPSLWHFYRHTLPLYSYLLYSLPYIWPPDSTLVSEVGGGQREECRTWQPSSPAPTRATDPVPPATEVPVTVEAPPLASASTGTSVPVEVEATAGAPASPKAGPSGVGGSVGLGWREAKGKKKRKKKKGGGKTAGGSSIG